MSDYVLKPIDFNPFEDEKEIGKVVFTNEPQKEIWLSCAIGVDESNLAYNESVSLDLKGSFQPDYFIEAIQDVISRHEILRATVSADGESLLIYKQLPFHLPLQDISADKDQKATLNAFISKEMQQVFDLQQGPLFRACLHKLDEEHYYFTIISHHIIIDGWSMGVILEDLSKFYNAKLKGERALLDKAPQIGDYTEEIAEFKKSTAYQQTEDYWINLYKDNVPVLDLPTDFPRPATRTYKSSRIDHQVPMQLIEQLKKTGAKAGCSLVNTLLSAFEIFLYLQTNQKDIVLGLPSAGQAATGHLGLVGHCVNLLPLRSTIDSELTFTAYLKSRRQAFFDAQDNQKFTYGELIKKLNIKRDHSRIPLVPVIFNIDMGMDSAVSFDNLTFKLASNPRASETFELFLNATGSPSSFILEWSYNVRLFSASTIKKMAVEFEQLLTFIVSNETITIQDLKNQRTKALEENLKLWNDTAVDYQKDIPFMELIDQAALKWSGKTAITHRHEALTYANVVSLSNQFAAYLISKGVKNGDIIGLSVERSVQMVISLLGILKAGAAYLPLDPEFPQERIQYMLADSNAKILLVSKTYADRFQSGAVEIKLEDIWSELKKYPADSPLVSFNSTDLAYVLYTSGSTGKPKGVKIMHYNLLNLLISIQSEPGITAADRLLAITTISFDIATLELFLPLISGAELIICDTEVSKDGRLLLELLAEKNISIMQATPATWRMLIESDWNEPYPLKIFCGGEPLPKDLANGLLSRSAELWNMYGPTETTIYSIIKRIQKEDKIIAIGHPVQNTQVYLLNDQLELTGHGIPGEIFIGGEGVGAGYLNQPELTEERFLKDPFSTDPQARLYRTGDLGKFLESGEIQYLGRIDQQVKIRGFRIELGEIETILAEFEEIQQVVVLAREDYPNEKRLAAYVILRNKKLEISKSLTDRWKNNLKKQLPDYMIPSYFVVLDAFPLTPNHKIDKKALPKPQLKTSFPGTAENLPHNESEQLISAIWASVLNLDNVSTKDDFFELGGHSLLAAKVMTAIEKQTGKRLPLATLFENATIEKLAKKLQANEEEHMGALVPIKTQGTKDPIYLIHGAGLNILLFKSISKYFDDEQPVYGMQAAGLGKDAPLLYTIEEIAAVYIEEVLEKNPDGPYCLAGYSAGGFIAFEMARQLIAMGKKIKFLGIVDSYAGNINALNSRPSQLIKKIKRQFKKIPFIIKSFINYPKDTLAYQLNFVKRKLNSLFPTHIKVDTDFIVPYEEEIYRSYIIAHQNYTLVPIDVKISLFTVSKRLYYIDDQLYLGWDKFAEKGVNVYSVPGDHKTFLDPPNDKEFSQIFQQVLDKS